MSNGYLFRKPISDREAVLAFAMRRAGLDEHRIGAALKRSSDEIVQFFREYRARRPRPLQMGDLTEASIGAAVAAARGEGAI